MSRILVTGAGGFVAGHLLAALAAEGGHELLGVDRRPALPVAGGAFLQLDLRSRPAVADLVSRWRPDWIVHLAGLTAGAWPLLVEANVSVTRHLLAAVRDTGRSAEIRVLAIGSAAEYGLGEGAEGAVGEGVPLKPVSDYGLSKAAQTYLVQRWCAASGLGVVLARTFNLIGPGLGDGLAAGRWARQIVAGERQSGRGVLETGPLEARRDFLDVRDATRAYRALLERGAAGQVYNVGSGRATSMQELLDLLLARTSTSFIVRRGVEPPRGEGARSMIADIAKLRRCTGWAPRIGLATSVEDLLASWRMSSGSRV